VSWTTAGIRIVLALAALPACVFAACRADASGPAQDPAAIGSARRTLGSEAGFAGFQTACVNCHGNPNVPEAPGPSVLAEMSPEAVYDALTLGTMAAIGQRIPDEMKRLIAESATGRLLGTATSGNADAMPNRCPGNPPLRDPAAGPAWNGWGVDIANTRFQPGTQAGLTAEQVRRLTLRWAFGFPNGVSAWGQPTVASGRVFVGSDTGYVYSLDADTGCVYWSLRTKAGVRNAISLGPLNRSGTAKYAAYFGDVKGSVYGVNAQTGEVLWSVRAENHLTARITAAPTLHDGRLYVPISSWEEFSARAIDYPCCTFRGSVVALDASTGRQLWKTYAIPEAPQPTRKNSAGVQQWGPAGASVFNSPTVDLVRRAIYFGTGNDTSGLASQTSDAVMAVDMNTGKRLWVHQVFANDTFLIGCNFDNLRTENCPPESGPDLDIPASPILRRLSNGRRILVVGTKSGDILGLDPDRQGALVWQVNVADGKTLNGVGWGGAADERKAYFGLTQGGVVAIQLGTGERVWFAPVTPPGPVVSHRAAVTALPGVVLVGGSDGGLSALSAADGRTVWNFMTNRSFATVNRIPARGGGLRAPGPTVAGGMLFAGSGYGVGTNDLTGNVLLAFSIEK
jgi:polyvinyl alcohol dehydrogenase (cytochrome)